MGNIIPATAFYGQPTQIAQSFWGPSEEVTIYGLPCVAILGFLCLLLLLHRKLLIEYQNTITFITFGCFFTATPIVWYNVMIFIGMEITNGNFKFTLFWCTFFKVSTLSLWFCSFVVPSVVSFNRYLIIVHNKHSSLRMSIVTLIIVYFPMMIVDILSFFIGTPQKNDTCESWLYVNLTPIPQLYTMYIFLVSASGVLFGKLTLVKVLSLQKKGARVNDRQLSTVIYTQAWVPFLATTFFVISNLGVISNWYDLPIWFTRPANIYAVIGTTLLIPLITLVRASKIRNAAMGTLCLERFIDASSQNNSSGKTAQLHPSSLVKVT